MKTKMKDVDYLIQAGRAVINEPTVPLKELLAYLREHNWDDLAYHIEHANDKWVPPTPKEVARNRRVLMNAAKRTRKQLGLE